MSNCFVSCITTILKLSSDFLIVCFITYLLPDLSRLFYLLSQRSLITLLVIKFSNFLLLTIFHVDITSFLKYISPVASLIFYFIYFFFFCLFFWIYFFLSKYSSSGSYFTLKCKDSINTEIFS